MYALAAKDLSRDELQAVTANDLRKEALDDVAEWMTALRVYRLRPQLYGRVYAELWPRYTPEQRALARARVGRGVGAGLSEPLASRERAAEAAERYRAQREQLLKLGEELGQAQRPFDELDARLRAAEERGDEAEVRQPLLRLRPPLARQQGAQHKQHLHLWARGRARA